MDDAKSESESEIVQTEVSCCTGLHIASGKDSEPEGEDGDIEPIDSSHQDKSMFEVKVSERPGMDFHFDSKSFIQVVLIQV